MAENTRESNPLPNFELPQTPGTGQEAVTERAIEKPKIGEDAAGKKAPKLPVPPPEPSDVSQAQAAHPQQQTVVPAQGQLSGSMVAEDTDLIEKQWVDKAKSIVARTQDDPHKQKDEMSKFKAEYVKKRFNKTIPIDDTVEP